MADAHKNFAYSTVATAPSPATSGTSLVVTTGDGAKFPAAPFNATIWPSATQPTTANAEIVRVTAVSTDTLTITRAQESTTARTVVIGDQISATITAKTLTDVERPANLTTVTVAASNASAQDKAQADYLCTGTADDVKIQAAIDAVKSAGGAVFLSGGTFAISTTLNIAGSTAGSADNVNVMILGRGNETTILNCATNTNGFTITAGPKLVFRDFQIKVLGTGTGIVATGQSVSPYWSFWDSEFTNIMVRGDFSTHTGYVMDLESCFRSTFTNIEAKGVKNGVRIKSHNSAFNPGNCTFTRCFMDLSQANGVGWTIQSVSGYMNICTFNLCECIDSSGSSTTSIGWLFTGTSSYGVRNIFVLHSNVEVFNTCASFIYSTDNDVWLNYADTKNNGTIFLLDANSANNNLRARQGYVPPAQTTTLINDSYTGSQPNILSGYSTFVSGTLNKVNSTATIIRESLTPGSVLIGTFDLPANKLQATPVSSTAPTANQALTYNSTSWIPTTIGISVSSISGNTTGAAGALINYVVECTAALTYTLPTAVGNTSKYSIKNFISAGGTVTISTTSSQTIDGQAAPLLVTRTGDSVDLVSNGTNWRII